MSREKSYTTLADVWRETWLNRAQGASPNPWNASWECKGTSQTSSSPLTPRAPRNGRRKASNASTAERKRRASAQTPAAPDCPLQTAPNHAFSKKRKHSIAAEGGDNKGEPSRAIPLDIPLFDWRKCGFTPQSNKKQQSPQQVSRKETNAVSYRASYVGAAVGTSGQKPFIRQASRSIQGYGVMPSFAERRPEWTSVVDSLPYPFVAVSEGKQDPARHGHHKAWNGSPVKVLAANAPHKQERWEQQETAAPHTGMRSPHKRCIFTRSKTMHPPSIHLGEHAPRRRGSVVHITAPISTSAGKLKSGLAAQRFTRQVSALCMSVLQERDRRLERQRALQAQTDANEGGRTHSTAAVPTTSTPPRTSPHALHPTRVNPPTTAQAAPSSMLASDISPTKFSAAASVLQSLRGVLERREGRRFGANPNASPSASPATDSVQGGASSSQAASDAVVSARQKPQRGALPLRPAGCDRARPSPTETTIPNAEDNTEDEGEWAEEDTWWAFHHFWSGPIEAARPPPPFVPPIDLRKVLVPSEGMAWRSSYAIPMPSPTTAAAKERQGARPRAASIAFTDQSDALADGRGAEREAKQRMRKWRIHVLLLESYERRGRRTMLQEEGAAWMAMREGTKGVSSGWAVEGGVT